MPNILKFMWDSPIESEYEEDITSFLKGTKPKAAELKVDESEYEENITSFLKGTKPKNTKAVELKVIEPKVVVQEIRIDQTPTASRWNLIPLYKISADGGMLCWQIGFDGVQHLEIRSGYNEGVMRMDRVEVASEVAFRQARTNYRLKYREGYQPAGQMMPTLITGMKSYDYTPKSIKAWPVYTQPKLHGIRMLCQDDHGLSRWDRTNKTEGIDAKENIGLRSLNMRSWLNNAFGHLQHIEAELVQFFEYLPRYATLDGELYNHELRFGTIRSAVKTVTSVHPQLLMLQYWIFDIDYEDPEGAPYEKRYELLVNAFRRYLQDRSLTDDPNDLTVLPRTFRIVPVQLARNHAEVLQQHQLHVQNKFEGIMVKKISNGASPETKLYRETLYTSRKCNHILKYKHFLDTEALVISFSTTPTLITSTTPSSTIIVQDKQGHRYPITMRGTGEEKQAWALNPDLIVGAEVTIRYQEVDPHGIPIHPIGIAIRNYE